MRLIEVARRVLITSNGFPPFFYLNRKAYDLAIEVFKWRCSRLPNITSIFVKHREWIPGLSDIDVVIVLGTTHETDEYFFLTKKLSKIHQATRRIFPMLVDVSIVDQTHFRNHPYLPFQGHRIEEWELVYGLDARVSSPGISENRPVIDRIDFALGFYRNLLLPQLSRSGSHRSAGSLELYRCYLKIRNALDCSAQTVEFNKFSQFSSLMKNHSTALDILCSVIALLDQRLADLENGGLQSSLDSYPGATETNRLKRKNSQHLSAGEFGKNAPEGVCSIVLGCEGLPEIFVVVDNDIDHEQLARCVSYTLDYFQNKNFSPTILSVRGFKFLLGSSEPLIYLRLLTHGVLLYGEDILQSIHAPPIALYRSSLLRYSITALFSLPFRYTSEPQNHQSHIDWEDHFLWMIRLIIYLQSDTVEEKGENWLFENFKSSYPNQYGKFETLSLLHQADCTGSNIRKYALQKYFSNTLHKLVTGYYGHNTK